MTEGDNPEPSREPEQDRSHIYMGIVLGVIILVMTYLTLFVDDPWRFFHRGEPVTLQKENSEDLLNETKGMSDGEIRQSLIKFIQAFYFDQKRGYFDPPSYFAQITETFYNYHNLTYARLKEQYWNRRSDMQGLRNEWMPASLEFRRDSGMIIANYWLHEEYYRPSQHSQQSALVRIELMINEAGRIYSLKELEVKDFESSGFSGTREDSIVTDSVKKPSVPAPQAAPAVVTATAASEPEVNDQKIYELGAVDSPPEFPGGQKELNRFLAKNLKYPPEARQNAVEGRVFIGFIIEKNGSVADIKVLRGIGSGCDEEALRVIRLLPAWKPAMSGGKPVRNAYVLSVVFKMGE